MKRPSAAGSFDELYSLKQVADRLRERQAQSLSVYNNEPDGRFGFKADRSKPDQQKISISSTATCIGSLILTGSWNTGPIARESKPWWAGKEEAYARELLRAKWTSAGLDANNPFSVSFVLEACCLLSQSIPQATWRGLLSSQCDFTDEEYEEGKGDKQSLGLQQSTTYQSILDSATKCLISALFETAPNSCISVLNYPPSSFLTQLCARALKLANAIGPQQLDPVADWAAQEIARQVTLINASSRDADPLQLIYSVICLGSFRSTLKETPNELDLINHGLLTFFGRQNPDGSWPLSRPLFHYPKAGSAYCYDYEALAQLFLCAPLYDSLFAYLPEVTRATMALDRTKFRFEEGGFGWASNHHPQNPGPESWSTASVYLFLFALDRFIAEGVRRAIADELELPYSGISRPAPGPFAPRFLDCPRSATDKRSLKTAIHDRVATPLRESAQVVSRGQRLPEGVPVSAILFGPPGTSKTEIVEQIAKYVGWPAFSIDPSYFVRDGLDAIQARANRIFRMLSVAEEVVVLFDEFDEMVRDRENANEVLSRFLTTAMLPKLSRINKQRRLLFIVATNYIDSFDIAISRAGRFDMVIQMMPPTTEAKLGAPDDGPTRNWGNTLRWVKSTLKAKAFDLELADLTFLETRDFVLKVAKLRETDETTLTAALPTTWKDTVKNSTLRRERDPVARENSKDGNWKKTSEQQVRFVRFDD